MEESTSQTESLRNQLVGQRIGSYRILNTLGSGGMSTVYKAVHVDTGHVVALKVLIGTLSRSSTLLQRFLREARSAETLQHGNIVTIYDRGVDQGRHYLVLEYVAGGDFHDYVQRNGPLDVREAIAVIRGVASGLRYAAGRGLIHRDIKPSNLLRTPGGEPKIIDLGLALQSQFEDERVTREGTTVGTVDYMAPEQARDSRATSIHSDMYSLGCTFYYLLAGIPPYPGGDITEKLTRHARAPAPDIRDLRPEVPAEAASILLRLMAKQPDERFADYDRLIAALDAVGPGAGHDPGDIALAPLEPDEPSRSIEVARMASAIGGSLPGQEAEDEAMVVGSLDGPLLDLSDERAASPRRPDGAGAEAPLPRLGRTTAPTQPDEPIDEEAEGEWAPAPAPRLLPWILATSSLAALAIALAVGLHMLNAGHRPIEVPGPAIAGPVLDLERSRAGRGSPAIVRPAPPPRVAEPGKASPKEPKASERPPVAARPSPIEPEDRDPVAGEPRPIQAEIQRHRARLPEWTRSGEASRPVEPVVVVRRVADAADGMTEPSLNLALNRHNEGTVELADVGPLPVDDLHMSGESRVIRARRGYRPIIHILRSRLGPAVDQPAILLLKQKTLTLEGVDIIVDAIDLSGKQTALFGCVGSNLTLRDCTVTVINRTGARFSLVRQEASPRHERAVRPSRIWLDRTLIRGNAVTVADLSGGPVDLVLDGTAILDGTPERAAGLGTPLVRVSRPDGPDEQRIFLAGALLACPGPVIQCEQPEGAAARLRPLLIRADGSAFGRLNGPGIASIVTSTDARTPAGRQVAWSGDSNLFAGWKGFFAAGESGPNAKITVDDLAQARSTWNATEQDSQWIIPDWPLTGDPARQVARGLEYFLLGRHSLMAGPARPGAGLYPKTIEVYPEPAVPDPSPWTFSGQGTRTALPQHANAPIEAGRQPERAGQGPPGPGPSLGQGRTGMASAASTGAAELEMRTDDPRWAGDLGAFLRTGITSGRRHVRVRVVGSGAHRFTPVRLPEGLFLEIHVEGDPTSGGPPTWSPDPRATGPGLIELRRGALIASNLILRHEPTSRLESLLALDASHLVLVRCRLIVPPDSGGAAGDLITFRAATTRPENDHPGNAAFSIPVDRPICRLIDTVLIANRTALRADVGRALVALSRCAVASDETAIELGTSGVARRSFDADLWLDRCTIAAARSIVRLRTWRGVAAGPDRPWVINSRRNAFFTLTDGKTRDGVLLRVDADAYAGGCLLWQADGDAFDIDRIVAAGEVPPPPTRPGEMQIWAQFWASHHATGTVAGPRATAPRFRRRPRPGRIEPGDLILELSAPGPRGLAGVGADLPGLLQGPQSSQPASRPD